MGYYDVQTGGNATPYAQGLTVRYVNGEPRLLNRQVRRSDTRNCIQEPAVRLGHLHSLESVGEDGWNDGFHEYLVGRTQAAPVVVTAIDYTASVIPTQIYTRTLNANGSVSNEQGPSASAEFPPSASTVEHWNFLRGFRPRVTGVPRYGVGFGGYTSLMLQGGNISLGPALYAMPDPAGYAPGSTLSTSEFKTLLDFSPSNQYRGTRLTLPLNYFDGGGGNGPQQAGSNTRPTFPPLASGSWLSPADDGTGWWTWGSLRGRSVH